MGKHTTADKFELSSQTSAQHDSVIIRLVESRLFAPNQVELNNRGFAPGNMDLRALAGNTIITGYDQLKCEILLLG